MALRYDWIVRTRPDLGWLAPPPPLSSLSAAHVHVPDNIFPINDNFAVVPRALAPRYFEAARGYYQCDRGGWFAPGSGDTESVLYRFLREVPPSHQSSVVDADECAAAAGAAFEPTPLQPHFFAFVLLRPPREAGAPLSCELLPEGQKHCEMLRSGPEGAAWPDTAATAEMGPIATCVAALRRWAGASCAHAFGAIAKVQWDGVLSMPDDPELSSAMLEVMRRCTLALPPPGPIRLTSSVASVCATHQ